jgi:hypothetical protein
MADENRTASKREWLLSHPPSGGVSTDAEPLETPPETPPGEPSGDTNATADASTTQPKPDAPVFTAQQTSKMVGDAVEGAFKKVFPDKPSNTSADSPAGPTPTELQAQIDKLDNDIDLAVQEGKSVRELNRARDNLRDQKFDIERVQPLRQQGSTGINSLVLDNLRMKEPLYDKYEAEFMKLLGPSLRAGQVLTMEVVQEGFALIKGRHIKEIIADEKEAEIRKAKNTTDANLPGGTSGRRMATEPKSPDTIVERFGDKAAEAFRSKKNKGMDEDAFARRLGYQDKAAWFKKDDELSKDTDGSFGLDR